MWDWNWLFSIKIEVNVDAYKDKRTNILQGRGIIPATLGKEADIIANVGEAERYGVDGDVRYNQAFANSLWIQVQGNFTFAKSRYLYFEEAERPWMPWGAHKGKPFDAHWGFVAERLFIDQYDIDNSAKQNFGQRQVMPGDIKFKDMDGDGEITGDDWVQSRLSANTRTVYGFGFSMGYKMLDFTLFFRGLPYFFYDRCFGYFSFCQWTECPFESLCRRSLVRDESRSACLVAPFVGCG